MSSLPICPTCHYSLRRVDHYGIEHLTFDNKEYRPLHAGEGLASEVDLRCGQCGTPLTRQARAFFYKRWVAVKEATAIVARGAEN